MGVEYQVGCLTCGVYRDLDKHMGGATKTPNSRSEAIAYGENEIIEHPFRYGLLVSFLIDHASHVCKLYCEGDDDKRLASLVPEQVNFWKSEGVTDESSSNSHS